MAYGKLKADTLVYDNGGSDVEVSLSTVVSKANVDGQTFTGNVVLPTTTTATTQAANDNSTKLATTAYVDQSAFAPSDSPTFTGTVAIPNIADVETAITGKADLTGANFTGDVDIAQGDKLTLGSSYEIYESSGSSELRIKSLAGHMRHQLPASHSVLIEGPTDEIAKFTEGGSCELYYDDVKKFETTSTGVTVTGDITAVDLTLSGDLTVNGTMTTVDTDNLVVKDSLIYLARENTVNTLDIGIYGKYIDNTAPEYTGLFRDQTDSKWKLFDSLEVIPTTTVDTSGTGYAAATLVVGTLEDSKGDVRKIPENAKTTNYTLLIGDAGKHIKFTPGDANQTLTVPDSVFSEGDAVTIVNNSTNNLAIAKGTNMYYAADASNANRTLAGRGMATLLFTAADTCYISGAGLS